MDDPQLKDTAKLLSSAPNSQSTFQRVDEYPRPSRFGTTLFSHSYYNHTMLNKCYSATRNTALLVSLCTTVLHVLVTRQSYMCVPVRHSTAMLQYHLSYNTTCVPMNYSTTCACYTSGLYVCASASQYCNVTVPPELQHYLCPYVLQHYMCMLHVRAMCVC